MTLFKWIEGRQQGVKYKKFCLWYFKIFGYGFDAYILKYDNYSDLPVHSDEIENAEHYRLNIKIKGFARFCILDIETNRWQITTNSIVLFRPDLYPHCLQVGPNGCTKLSFGFVKFLT